MTLENIRVYSQNKCTPLVFYKIQLILLVTQPPKMSPSQHQMTSELNSPQGEFHWDQPLVKKWAQTINNFFILKELKCSGHKHISNREFFCCNKCKMIICSSFKFTNLGNEACQLIILHLFKAGISKYNANQSLTWRCFCLFKP